MPLIHIDGPADPRIATYRSVSDAELLRRHGLFVAEGRLVVRRVLDAGFRLHSVLINETNYRALADALAAVSADVPVFVCDTHDFQDITGFNLHRGCLALVERPAATAVCEILRNAQRLVVLEGATNADNVGGIFRNAAAFAVDGVLLSPTCCDPLYRKAIRTSMGATMRVPFAWLNDWPAGLADVRATGFTLVALTPRRSSMTLDQFAELERPPRMALLLGTEGDGLSDAAVSAADVSITIPMSGLVDSLNLAVACGIALSRLSDTGRL
jgi:tRNA G18 (ribose-2'-O)-methylase SpoU